MTEKTLIIGQEFLSTPEAMRKAKRWLLYRLVLNKDPAKKPRKVPYYADGKKRHGSLDTDADQAHFAIFEDALRRFQIGGYSGLGFALGPDGTGNHWQGIDLDDMPNRPALQLLKDELPGYLEISPSGNGMHAIGYGRAFDTLGSNASGIEAYAKARYFTVTGKGDANRALKCIAGFVEAVLSPMHRAKPLSPINTASATYEVVPDQTVRDLRSALIFMWAEDRALWVRLGHALKTLGDVGRGLWLEWSAVSLEKYDPQDAVSKWESFQPDRTGYKAVFAAAQRLGWLNPAIQATYKSALHPSFGFVPVHDLLQKPEPIQWLIQSLIEMGTLITLFGASGAGKSFVALDWTCCIATGSDWHGMATERGAVFYIAGEGHSGIRRRLRAWEIHKGIQLKDAPLFVSTCPAALMDATNAGTVADAVEALVEKHGNPSLIVIDTLARNFGGGEENNNSDVGQFINNIDVQLRVRFGAAVLIVHHSGHQEADRGRGASALRAAMDAEYRLELKDDIRTLICTKAKESEKLAPMSFMLEEVELEGWPDEKGQLMTSAVLKPAVPIKRSAPGLKGANRIALSALTHTLNAHGEAPTESLQAAKPIFTPSRVVSEDRWRERAYDSGISDGEQGAKKKAFSRSRKELLELNLIGTWQDMYWLTPWANDQAGGQGT